VLPHQQPVYADAYDIDRDPLRISSPDPGPVVAMAWYHCDHLGTPQELTDAQGEIAWSAHYHAWGAAKETITDAARAAGIRNPIRFQGPYLAPETSLHYNRHRYYDPQIGRFISKDPIGFAGGLNVYQYADNPVRWVDPLGLRRTLGEGCPKCPETLVGDQSDPRAGPNKGGGKHTSGPLLPEHGGTGDFRTDLDKLAGGVQPWSPGDKAPPGSLVGQNGIFGRPNNSSGGQSIDIPAQGKKPHETLHY